MQLTQTLIILLDTRDYKFQPSLIGYPARNAKHEMTVPYSGYVV